MVSAAEFYKFLLKRSINHFYGVPDTTLKGFCDYLASKTDTGIGHIVAANEGGAVALASGYHLATGKTALVYLQNSGTGNIVNPVASLTDCAVCGIPVVYLIGWRGKPGIKDEPQHIKQGGITLPLLELLGMETYVITKESSMADVANVFDNCFEANLRKGKSAAFVVESGSFEHDSPAVRRNSHTLVREQAVSLLADAAGETDIVVSTTGKISRELFDYRECLRQSHDRDFLTVGAMGHVSMIALAVAEHHPNRRVWCLDGDGSLLMHMGALAIIGSRAPENLLHVLLNNGAHESAGGAPTVSYCVNWLEISSGCGYKATHSAKTLSELKDTLRIVKSQRGPIFIEALVNLESRSNLGRPAITAKQNKISFIEFLNKKDGEKIE